MQEIEILKVGSVNVEVGVTGSDWEPKSSTRYYAQVLPHGIYAFGATKEEALCNLKNILKQNKAPSHKDNDMDGDWEIKQHRASQGDRRSKGCP